MSAPVLGYALVIKHCNLVGKCWWCKICRAGPKHPGQGLIHCAVNTPPLDLPQASYSVRQDPQQKRQLSPWSWAEMPRNESCGPCRELRPLPPTDGTRRARIFAFSCRRARCLRNPVVMARLRLLAGGRQNCKLSESRTADRAPQVRGARGAGAPRAAARGVRSLHALRRLLSASRADADAALAIAAGVESRAGEAPPVCCASAKRCESERQSADAAPRRSAPRAAVRGVRSRPAALRRLLSASQG